MRSVMTGGVVAHNTYLVTMTEELIGRSILVPEFPQFTGALGAALYAMAAEEKDYRRAAVLYDRAASEARAQVYPVTPRTYLGIREYVKSRIRAWPRGTTGKLKPMQ